MSMAGSFLLWPRVLCLSLSLSLSPNSAVVPPQTRAGAIHNRGGGAVVRVINILQYSLRQNQNSEER